MTQKDTLSMILNMFKERTSGQSYRKIMKVMEELKRNGMTIDQAIRIIDALNCFTNRTKDYIADYCEFRVKEIGSKHPNYFWQLCQNKAKEPRVFQSRTERIKLNL